MPENDLIWIKMLEGDKNAFLDIYHKNYQFLFAYGFSITLDKELTKDCLQEMFLELWNSRQSINSDVRNVKSYLFKTWDMTSALDKQIPGNAATLLNPIDFIIGQDLPTDKYVTVDDGTGNFFVNYGGFWTGDMDDVLFYNIALTAPQVKSIFVNQNTL